VKVSLNWLNEYVDVSEFYKNTEALDKILTDAGLEVDGVEDMAKNFNHVVVGHIKNLEKHPDADKLTVCSVDVGGAELQQIVCGAKNHKAGDKVIAALPGAVLPGDFKIKKSKIRGVESLGMLCSASELGMDGDSDGITILEEGAEAGRPFADHAGLNDIVFELSVTANRSDCLSHIGLARELSCLLDKPLKYPPNKVNTSSFKVSDHVKVELKDEKNCPRYSARIVRGVKVGPSPAWLKTRLEQVDINSVNNVVDITNFIMLEYGQPMHSFDLKNINGSSLLIKEVAEGEEFVSLDGTEYKLSAGDLAICDSKRVVALAGVVGGQNSGISDETTDLLLEVAHFSQSTVRKTSRRLGISTDSSYRFSRGTDPNIVKDAMDRACHLIQKICGGEVSSDTVDLYPSPIVKEPIQINTNYASERLGYKVEEPDFVSWMKRLGCELVSGDSGELVFNPPSWRWDLEIKEDLVEEFGRLNGYDKIPESLPPLNSEPLTHDKGYIQDRHAYNFFSKQGYYQSVNYNFLGEEYLSNFVGSIEAYKNCGFKVSPELAKLQNPLSEEYNVMRPSLAPTLFKNLMTNYRSGVSSSKLFEIGKVFGVEGEAYFETRHLGLIAWGQKNELWQNENTAPLVLSLKETVENFLRSLKAKSWSWKTWSTELPYLHPGKTATLFFEGKNIGYIGEIHPKLKDESKIREDVAFAEFNLELLMRSFPKKPKLSEISKYPAVERDFSFVVNKTVASEELKQFITKTQKNLIKSVEVVDIFSGDKLPEGKHSLTYKVLFQDMETTLTDDVIKKLHGDILNKVNAKFS